MSARGNKIVLTADPKGVFLEGIVSGTPKPGTSMEMVPITGAFYAGGRHQYRVNTSGTNGKRNLVAILLAVLAKSMSDSVAQGAIGLPKIPLSPVLYAVLLGMLWRNTLGVPAWTSDGLNWAMHRLLRTGIALVGLRLTLAGASAIAVTALPVALGCLATALVARAR